MRIRKSVLLGAILIATALGALHLAGLSKAANQAPTADDECRFLSCIFDDDDVD